MKAILSLITFWAVTAAALAAELEQGRQVYETAGGYGCIVCHGVAAHGAGQAGGYIRGANAEAITKSLTVVPSMMPLQSALTDTQISQLSAYLQSLAPIALIKFDFDGSDWHGTFEPFSDKNSVDIVFYNNSFETALVHLPNTAQAAEIQPLASLLYRYTVEKTPIDLIWLVQQGKTWQQTIEPLPTP